MSDLPPPDRRPWWLEPTRAQWVAFAAAWFGWVLDAFDFTVYLLVMPDLMKTFGVSSTATAASIALTLLVRLLGGLGAGWAADRWGRKLPLVLSIAWFALCDGAIAWAPSFGAVLALRTLFGFGMGAEWTAGATLAMENWPARSRGLASGVLQGSWAIGYLLAAQAAAVVVPAYGWRALFVVAAAPALLVLPLALAVKEAPRDPAVARSEAGWGELVKTPGVVRNIAWGSAVLALGFGVYYGMTGLYATLLKGTFQLDLGAVATHVTLFNLGMMIGAVTAGSLAMEFGVVRALQWPAVAMALVAPLYVGAVPALLGLGAFLGGVFGAGSSGATPVLLTSLFPPQVRARSVGLVYHLGAIPAAFAPMGIAALADSGVARLPVAIGAVITACAVALALLLQFGPVPSGVRGAAR